MSDLLIRAVTPDLEVQTRAKGGDGRTIVGYIVPFNVPMEIRSEGIVEEFLPDVFRHQEDAPNRIKLAREHLKLGGVLIGRAMLLRGEPKGMYGELRVARTEVGDETLALIEDGALTDLSVAFIERQNRLRGGITQRVKADLREVAVTLAGAYGELATVAAVRSEQEQRRLDEAAQILASFKPLPTV